jgi:Holliday junction resolvase RusA-like endonuclease
MSMIDIVLPLPPTANNLFANRRKGRRVSEQYEAWRTQAGWALKQQRPPAILGRFDLSLLVPQAMRGDISNRIKAAEDLLVTHRLIEDDRHAASVKICRSPDVEPGTIRIIVEPTT